MKDFNPIKPQIQISPARKLVGMAMPMSLSENRVADLWRKFLPRKAEVLKTCSTDLISMAVYDSLYFAEFTPSRSFEKWACVEVEDFTEAPEGLRNFMLPEGLYAVFHYIGLNTDPRIYDYIFRVWLPQSGYLLDQRPHFEILGSKYKNNDASSEEDLWIPIREVQSDG